MYFFSCDEKNEFSTAITCMRYFRKQYKLQTVVCLCENEKAFNKLVLSVTFKHNHNLACQRFFKS